MYSLAYVILPFAKCSPAEAISASLARFRRGRRGDVPESWLRFHDETAEVEAMHRATFTFTRHSGLRVEGRESWYLDTRAVMQEMDRRGREQWTVRFADVEPDLDRFAERFLRPFDRHPVTGGFGFWRNPLGRWDWWELGGRFDGAITGQRSGAARGRSTISSGPSEGRALLENLQDAVGAALGEQPLQEIDIHADANVELVATLRHNLAKDNDCRPPGALVLPPGSAEDEQRWIANWPETGPADALALLGLPPDAAWPRIVRAVYDRFEDHWVAGVAFHL